MWKGDSDSYGFANKTCEMLPSIYQNQPSICRATRILVFLKLESKANCIKGMGNVCQYSGVFVANDNESLTGGRGSYILKTIIILYRIVPTK